MLKGWVIGVNTELGKREESLWELHIWTWRSCYHQSVKNGREGRVHNREPSWGSTAQRAAINHVGGVCLPEISGLLELQNVQGHAFV